VLDKTYLPNSWVLAQNGGYPPGGQAANDEFAATLYHGLVAPYCRSCHVVVPHFDFDSLGGIFSFRFNGIGQLNNVFSGSYCGAPLFEQYSHRMPSSLVTFNEMWTDPGVQAALSHYIGQCSFQLPIAPPP